MSGGGSLPLQGALMPRQDWSVACHIHQGTQATHMMITPCGGLTSLCPLCATRMESQLRDVETVTCKRSAFHYHDHEMGITWDAMLVRVVSIN